MYRIACGIEYDGSAYRGWQNQKSQPDTPTVQDSVEKALSFVANEPVDIVCAGRTDCSVHATAQTIHFDTPVLRSNRSWLLGTNANLPSDIRLQWVKETSEDFHARFSAVSRAYRYVIDNSPVTSAILQSRVSWIHERLDESAMNTGAQYLVGEHDFSSFRAKACQANRPVRTITRLDITRSGRFIYIDIEANAFLYHMVRNIVGVLLEVGKGERDPEWVQEVLEHRDRDEASATALAAGLYLVKVEYPENFGLKLSGYMPVYG